MATGREQDMQKGKSLAWDGLVGEKKSLYFYEGDPIHGQKTNWKMIEYKLHYCSISRDHKSAKVKVTSTTILVELHGGD